MTLPVAFPISASQINVELGRTANAAFDIQGASERLLAGVPSGAISMSDFLGKSSFSIADQGTTTASFSGSSVSVPNVPIGAADANRRVFLLVHLYGGSVDISNPTTCTIGGVSATIHVNSASGGTPDNDPGEEVHAVIISAMVPTGTTATVVINFSTAWLSSSNCAIRSYRMVALTANSLHGVAQAQCDAFCGGATASIGVGQGNLLLICMTGRSGSTGEVVTMTTPAPSDYGANNYKGRMMLNQPAGTQLLKANMSPAGAISVAGLTWTV